MTEQNNLPARADHSITIEQKIGDLSGASQMMYSSLKTDTFKGRMDLLDAISDALPLNDNLDKVIQMRNFVAQSVEFADENGEMQVGIRTIIIDEDGNAYAAMSDGIISALRNIVNIMGDPSTWENALPVRAVEERGKRGFRYMTLKVARDKGKTAKA